MAFGRHLGGLSVTNMRHWDIVNNVIKHERFRLVTLSKWSPFFLVFNTDDLFGLCHWKVIAPV